MPDLYELIKHHGDVKQFRVELVIEHTNGFCHKVASSIKKRRDGYGADDMHRELLKTAGELSIMDIATDTREKQARSRK
jgi:hypothetical protein